MLPSWTKDIKKAPMLNNARAERVTEGKAEQPYYFRRPDDRPLAFAGLWERCGEIDSCTIITTEANEVMEPIHHRMPVILSENNYAKWFDPGTSDLTQLLVPCPADDLERFAVDRIVNNVRNQGPQCILPLNSA